MQVFLLSSLLWCKLGRPLASLKPVNAILPAITASIPVVSQSLKNDQAVSTVVKPLACALWWINYVPLRKVCLDSVQSKKFILSKLPIISRKLTVQAKN